MEGKYKLEINFVGDGRIFLNYWDYTYGNDVVAEYVDGALYDEKEEITLVEFLKRVQKTISQYPTGK